MSIIVSFSVLISVIVVSFVIGLIAGIALMAYSVLKKDKSENKKVEINNKNIDQSEL